MKRTSRPRRNPGPLDNPAFRRWFGDSKVVDERGEPLVVYHGTREDFDVFAFHHGINAPVPQAAYFTDSLRVAQDAAGFGSRVRILSVYLRIVRPLVLDAEGSHAIHLTEQVLSRLDRGKHDGVILRRVREFFDSENTSTTYAVFSPTQIKSATDNVGTFDPDGPSILRNPALPTALYHATPQHNLDSILQRGLLALNCSVTLSGGGVFLTDEKSLAQGYAERRFGVDDYDEPWLLLKIDPIQLDPSRFEPDPGQEAQLNAEDIEARGYTIKTMPWWVSLEETGQMVYAGNVPPGAIEPIEIMLPTKGGGETWEPVRVQRNRRTSRRLRRSSRRSR